MRIDIDQYTEPSNRENLYEIFFTILCSASMYALLLAASLPVFVSETPSPCIAIGWFFVFTVFRPWLQSILTACICSYLEISNCTHRVRNRLSILHKYRSPIFCYVVVFLLTVIMYDYTRCCYLLLHHVEKRLDFLAGQATDVSRVVQGWVGSSVGYISLVIRLFNENGAMG